ncbi:MAG TPA: LAGLIDADG family homing endonuclease [Candidatus Paceibacterota bacterium]
MANHTKHVSTEWNNHLAYAIGLIATDGNLSPDLRHIELTSKDKEIIRIFKKILTLSNKIGRKARGGSKEKRYFRLQFGSKNFFTFLMSIGLSPAKSKTIGPLKIPRNYFPAFIRGCLDGDGNINEFHHPESKLLQLSIRFVSASPAFLEWMLLKIQQIFKIKGGWIYENKGKSISTLSFGKRDGVRLLRRAYKNSGWYCLKRKRRIAAKYLGE